MVDSKHLKFREIIYADREHRAANGPKRFRVQNKHDFSFLGDIRWYSKWRKYAFYPRADTLFEHECLRDIAAFCEEQTKEKKTK